MSFSALFGCLSPLERFEIALALNWQQKTSSFFATLLQNESYSAVARFTTHVRTCLATNQVARFVLMGGKTRNIAIQFVWQQCCKTSCTSSCRPFYCSFSASLIQAPRWWWKVVQWKKMRQTRGVGVGERRGVFPAATALFPSRARLIFALLVLIRPHYTIWEPGTGYFSARCMYHHQDPTGSFKWLCLFNYSGNYFGLIKAFPNIVEAENSSKKSSSVWELKWKWIS